MVPRGFEPRTLRLLAIRSNQLSYETLDVITGWRFHCSECKTEWMSNMTGTNVSCGVRAHAQLPAVDLKSTPLTTRAN